MPNKAIEKLSSGSPSGFKHFKTSIVCKQRQVDIPNLK